MHEIHQHTISTYSSFTNNLAYQTIKVKDLGPLSTPRSHLRFGLPKSEVANQIQDP